jgi:hypothetical protein
MNVHEAIDFLRRTFARVEPMQRRGRVPGSETANAVSRVLPLLEEAAKLTPEQRAYLVEHCTAIADDDEKDIDPGDPLGSREPAMTADAHRKIAKLMEALNV